MKVLKYMVLCSLAMSSASFAGELTSDQANLICRKSAVAAARFILKTKRPLKILSVKVADTAEISRGMTYEFGSVGLDESLVTVHAYAYQDDRSCTLASIVNNTAGND